MTVCTLFSTQTKHRFSREQKDFETYKEIKICKPPQYIHSIFKVTFPTYDVLGQGPGGEGANYLANQYKWGSISNRQDK